jgi:5-methyltetrahydropteroyltriglutamate--homocysteine methyltransferase
MDARRGDGLNLVVFALATDRREMVEYPKYATTVIGAYSVPDWYEALDRLVAVGQLSMGSMADAQYRAGEAAIHDQELAGIDVITGGEMHRRTHNRHSPPNAMLNHFWQKIPAFQGSTRPKPITPHDPDVFHPAATCRDRIADTIDLGLVDEFNMVSALTRKPVKITMTGPHMLAKVAYDEYYDDLSKMIMDLSKLLRQNFKLLAAAGCKHIQIDEPLFTMADEQEVDAAVEAINLAIGDLPGDIHVSMHICQGNYAVGKEYDAQIGHRYFDIGRYKADKICRIECSSCLVEYDMAHHYEGLLGNKQLGVGAVDVQDPKVESGEVVAERIRALRWLAPEQTIVTSSCGFNHLPRRTAMGKLLAMVAAKRILEHDHAERNVQSV